MSIIEQIEKGGFGARLYLEALQILYSFSMNPTTGCLR